MRLLITGLSGFIGTNILDNLTEEHEVYSFSRSEKELKGVKNIKGNLLDAGSIYKAVKNIRPEAIILMGAISSLYAVEKNLLSGYLTNTKSLEFFIRAAQDLNQNTPPKIIFFSTDLVYDAYDFENEEGFGESDPPKSKTRYGRSKLEAEHLLSFYKNGTSLRIALTYGPANREGLGYVSSIRKNIEKSETIYLFRDEWRTAIDVNDIGKLVNNILRDEKQLPKVLNIGGNLRLSREELGKRLISKQDPSYRNIKVTNRMDTKLGKTRGKDCSLNNSHTKRLFEIEFNDLV